MVKLKNLKTGFYTTEELEGEKIKIVESVSREAEFRQTEDQKYICLKIDTGVEEKDWHLTDTTLLQLAAVMPQTDESWKGYQVEVVEVKKEKTPRGGKKYVCNFRVLGKDASIQGDITKPPEAPKPSPEPFKEPQGVNPQTVLQQMKECFKYFPNETIPEINVLALIKSTYPHLDEKGTTEYFGKLKSMGMIAPKGDGWRAV